MNPQLVARANVLREVLMIWDGLREILSNLFNYSELDDLVELLSN